MTDPKAHLTRLAASPDMERIRHTLKMQPILQTALEIQQIPAPTFAEQDRANYVQRHFEQFGLQDVAQDEVFNVYGRWPGTNSARPSVLLSAHLDTVFPADTDLTISYQHNRVFGPGLGDNSLGVASLLTMLQVLQTYEIQPTADIWFVANSREEGLGDLGGIRAAWDRLHDRLGAAIVIEGMGLGRVYHAGIAVRRLRISCQAPGGHSWQHFGRPTAVHGLIRLGARILEYAPPTSPRTTYNIGLIRGGHSVNSLATEADFYLDMRSESPEALATLEDYVRQAAHDLQSLGLTFELEVVGDRPAGCIREDHPLVQLASAALQVIDHQALYETGSTDANVLLANGLPTVTIGIAYGGNSHRVDEFIDISPLTDGIWHLLLLVLATADLLPDWQAP